ncbi:MAG: hypothetical protein V3R25_09960 [Nitrosomonadaceae bacterium]
MKESLKRLGIKRGSLLAGLLMFATVPLPGFNGNPTGFQLFHVHSARWIVFIRDSVDNNTAMIASIDAKFEAKDRFEDLKRDRRLHEDRLYELVDDNGNFKSDFKRKMWERRDDEIKDEIIDIKRDLDIHQTTLSDGMMFAQRDR